VYYDATISMSTASVLKFMSAFTWPSAWTIVVSRQYVYEVKFNERCSQSWLQTGRSLLTYYCYDILNRIVGLFWLSWSRLWSDAVNYETPMRSDVVIKLTQKEWMNEKADAGPRIKRKSAKARKWWSIKCESVRSLSCKNLCYNLCCGRQIG